MSEVNDAVKQAQEALENRKNEQNSKSILSEHVETPPAMDDHASPSSSLLSGEDRVIEKSEDQRTLVDKIDDISTAKKIAVLIVLGAITFFITLDTDRGEELTTVTPPPPERKKTDAFEESRPGDSSIESILNSKIVTVAKENVELEFEDESNADTIGIETTTDHLFDHDSSIDYGAADNIGFDSETDVIELGSIDTSTDDTAPSDTIIEEPEITASAAPDSMPELAQVEDYPDKIEFSVDRESTQVEAPGSMVSHDKSDEILETIKKQSELISELSNKVDSINNPAKDEHIYAPNLDVLYIAPASKHCSTCITHAVVMYKGDKIHIADNEPFKDYDVSITDNRVMLKDKVSGVVFSYWPIKE